MMAAAEGAATGLDDDDDADDDEEGRGTPVFSFLLGCMVVIGTQTCMHI